MYVRAHGILPYGRKYSVRSNRATRSSSTSKPSSYWLDHRAQICNLHHCLRSTASPLPRSRVFHVAFMISRGQIARKLYRSCLQDVAIGRNDPIPARDGRVSGIFFGRLGVAPSIFSTPISCRNYADRPISRPKAHTGRTTNSPRRKATVKSSDAADPDTAKHEAKAVSKAKTKAKANPKAKPKANSKAKSKAKPKKVSKSHIVGRPRLTEKQLEARKATNTRLRIVELKAKALLTRPKLLPASAFAVIFAEECKGNPSVQEGAKNAAIHYKAITPEKREVISI